MTIRLKVSVASSIIAAGTILSFAPASASYMSNCNALISKWQACLESGGSCSTQENTILAECKCHKKKGNDWKLVTAAVGKDGVWNPTIPYDDVPKPTDHRPPEGNKGKGSPDIDGNDQRDRGGPQEGNTGKGNPR